MADFVKNLFGGPKSAVPSSANDDADFADFAKASNPTPASVTAATRVPLLDVQQAIPTPGPGFTYTKWYRVWERTSPSDFYQEAFILPFIIAIVGLHIWGRHKNRRIAKSWIQAHAPTLENEFTVVGFGGRRSPSADDVQSSGLLKASASDKLTIPSELLKEKTAQEFVTYATGRQNVAFVDVKLSLFKRYNPMTLLLEWLLSFFMESIGTPTERMEATLYPFDGREKDLIPVPSQREQSELEARVKGSQSAYDGFVWAIVHKESMRRLREDRYDISFTSVKDNSKLPPWAVVMSESAEITELLLTSELIKAVEQVGEEVFESLIITDQPVDKPQRLNETIPKKRLHLSLRIPSSPSPTSLSTYTSSIVLFAYFLRLSDQLASSARFRPEVTRKIKAAREEEIKKLKKLDTEEKAEDRRLEDAKRKKTERDSKLKGMSAEEQRKFLEKEREKDQRKMGKKMTKKA
ncbi:MAG: hypothetical protein MMC33_005337 [Icmadophila ericetorum]|nr:hypothetical protein [Icmadophila ericetorum]